MKSQKKKNKSKSILSKKHRIMMNMILSSKLMRGYLTIHIEDSSILTKNRDYAKNHLENLNI